MSRWISQFFCNMNSSKNFTCPSGKLRTEFTSPTAKSTSPRLSDTTFFARCSHTARGQEEESLLGGGFKMRLTWDMYSGLAGVVIIDTSYYSKQTKIERLAYIRRGRWTFFKNPAENWDQKGCSFSRS